MVPVETFVKKLLSQEGDKYIFGHEVSMSDTDPHAFDCSELVEWGAYQVGVQPRVPDGSWHQARHCKNHGKIIPVSEALKTRGALLFRFRTKDGQVHNPFVSSVRPYSAHVAVSLGDGRTIEARGSKYGVGVFNAVGRDWTHAGLLPGIDYSPKEKGDDWMITKWLTEDGFRRMYRAGAVKGASEEAVVQYWVRERHLRTEAEHINASSSIMADLAELAAKVAGSDAGTQALQKLAKVKAVL